MLHVVDDLSTSRWYITWYYEVAFVWSYFKTKFLKKMIVSMVLYRDYITTAQEIKFFFKDLFSKCDQISSFLRICSHLLKKFLMEKLFFCSMQCY